MSKKEISYKNIAEEIAESLRAKLNRDPTPYLLGELMTDELKQRLHVKTFVEEDRVIGTFIYDGGVYIQGEEILGSIFHEVMRKLGIEETNRRYTGFRSDFSRIVKDSTITMEEFNEKLVLYNNLVFDWESFLYEREPFIYEPSPDLYIVHRVPWPLDMEVLKNHRFSTKNDVVEGFRKDCLISRHFEEWAGEKWVILLELIGYALLAGEYPLHKAFMLIGEGANGKSTYISLLESLVGEENVSHVSLQDLSMESGRFMRCYLYHRMLNTYADLPKNALKQTGSFKMLTGEDVILADRKHKDPIYFKSYAKLVFSTNELPEVYDPTSAFWRRWIVVEFPNKFEENEGIKRAILNDILPKEAPKILSYSLLAVKHVMVEGRFSFQEEEGSIKERWLREADSVYNFVKTGMEQGWLEESDKGADKDELYQLYVKFADLEDLDKAGKKTFTKRMEEMGYPVRKSGSRRYYAGIGIARDKLPSDYAEFRRGIE